MTDPKLQKVVRATLKRQADKLVGEIPSTGKKKNSVREFPQGTWDGGLKDHFDTMAEGESVDVEVVTDQLRSSGNQTVRLYGVATLHKVGRDGEREAALEKSDGFVNPYTFVPTLPRTGLEETGLGDGRPPSHAYHGDDQWSGTLAITLTTRTPLLLPVPARHQDSNEPKLFEVRVGPDGRPLIHGASLKGALRSAYETITASRYGVFFEHEDRLAYRVPAGTALNLTPARVYKGDDGKKYFRLCRADAEWHRTSKPKNEVQDAAWVPAYGHAKKLLRRLGQLGRKDLTDHHGEQVHARIVLYQYHRSGPWGDTKFQVWRATHVARTRGEIEQDLRANPPEDPEHWGNLSRVEHASSMIVQGWLSVTGYSIKQKHDERLFVETPGRDVPVTAEHESYWRSVLRAYDVAQGYHDPNATYSRDPAAGGSRVVRSRHVPSSKELRSLPPGTLVYVKCHSDKDAPEKITASEVHPVMIGRLPFPAAPADLLPESLRPAKDRSHLSPADRLFGWVPPGRGDDDTDTNDGASGYRGRLRVRSVTCTTDDWQPQPPFPRGGITLAPLSSPKPTQFRFYAARDQTGLPVPRRARKADGYAPGGGLRGRKMYRWREEKPEYWQPPADQEDRDRFYLALTGHRQHPTQLVRHRSWVRPGVTFRAELFLDGVSEVELAALIWLLTQNVPLRLGAGKPYGFGVVDVEIDPERTSLWDAAGVRAGWLSLIRPAPVDITRITALADRFGEIARSNPVLREATVSYVAAAGPVTHPVHYPRRTSEPTEKSYEWFVENERSKNDSIHHGWALPHVRDREQRLPYFVTPTPPRQWHPENGTRSKKKNKR